MEWQQLEYFQTVAELEHITRAAEKLSVSQSAVSRAIAQLEQELDVELFDRRGRRVSLNRYGKMFLRRVERARSELEVGRRELADATGTEHGIVALGFLHSLGEDLVPSIIREFRKIHPDVTFRLVQNSGETVMEALYRGDIDLCIAVAGLFEHGGEKWANLMQQEIVAALPVKHELASRSSIRIEELAGQPFIALKKDHTMRAIVDDACRRAGFTPNIAFEGDEPGTVRAFVAAGLGVSLLQSAGHTIEGMREVRARPKTVRNLGIGWIEQRYMPKVTAAFRDFVIGQRRRA